MEDAPQGWREEFETHPEYQRILARLEKPWWNQPVTWVLGGAVALTAAFLMGGWLLGSDDSTDTPSQAPATQSQTGNDQPATLSFQEKQQILNKFCNSSQMRGPAGDSSAFPICMGSYYVTDQGMVMPK